MKKFIVENKDNVIIAIVSIIAFILGCLSVGKIAIIIVGIIDILLFFRNEGFIQTLNLIKTFLGIGKR